MKCHNEHRITRIFAKDNAFIMQPISNYLYHHINKNILFDYVNINFSGYTRVLAAFDYIVINA